MKIWKQIWRFLCGIGPASQKLWRTSAKLPSKIGSKAKATTKAVMWQSFILIWRGKTVVRKKLGVAKQKTVPLVTKEFKTGWTGLKGTYKGLIKTLQKMRHQKTPPSPTPAGSTAPLPTKKRSAWWYVGLFVAGGMICLIILVVVLAIFIWVIRLLIGPIGMNSFMMPIWIFLGAALSLFSIIVLAILIQHWKKPNVSLSGISGKIGNLFSATDHSSWLKKLLIWVAIEMIAIALISKLWHIGIPAIWAWVWDWWMVVIPAHILIGFMVLRKSSGHAGGHSHGGGIMQNAKAFGSLALTVGMIFLCWQFGGCIGRMNNPDYAPPTAEVAPPPQIDPASIRMGAWEESVPPGEYSKWTIWHSGYKTEGKLSTPAKYLKGKLVGKEVVVYDMPLKWDRPGVPLPMSYGEAIRYYNEGTSPLTIQWSRRFQ